MLLTTLSLRGTKQSLRKAWKRPGNLPLIAGIATLSLAMTKEKNTHKYPYFGQWANELNPKLNIKNPTSIVLFGVKMC